MQFKYFTLEEFARSTTAQAKHIDNHVRDEHLDAAEFTLQNMDRLREFLGHPIHISSGYRSISLNAAIGGVSTSQHARAEAVDFSCPGFGTPKEICLAILKDYPGAWDQLINEPTWVHISFTRLRAQRRQVLTRNGPGRYLSGIHDAR